LRARLAESDQLRTLEISRDDQLQASAKTIELAMQSSRASSVRQACAEFLSLASSFYKVRQPGIRVLAARPLRVREGGSSIEMFGDYSPETMVIRLWMRTAIRKQVTSFGTSFSTLCHEYCHHLDCQCFGFPESRHTHRFYEHTSATYHRARGIPVKRLLWVRAPGQRWRIDWARTNRGG